MSLYVFNPFRASEELTPSQIRTNTMMSWFRVILTPIKYLKDLFKKCCEGVDYADYDNATTYARGERVIWEDYAVYEARVSTIGVQPTGAALSSTNWLKVLDDFIGLDESVRYTGQLIVFEYAINRRFKVTAPPYIYCEAIPFGAVIHHVQLFVPLALYNSLGPNGTARSARIVEFAKKYVMAGWDVGITTY